MHVVSKCLFSLLLLGLHFMFFLHSKIWGFRWVECLFRLVVFVCWEMTRYIHIRICTYIRFVENLLEHMHVRSCVGSLGSFVSTNTVLDSDVLISRQHSNFLLAVLSVCSTGVLVVVFPCLLYPFVWGL